MDDTHGAVNVAFGFGKRARRGRTLPIKDSSNVAPVSVVLTNVVPVITAFRKLTFVRSASSKVTRSTTAFVKSAPVKSACSAYLRFFVTRVYCVDSQ